MSGLDMALLRRRLGACGFPVRQFSYPSVRVPPRENAARLQRWLAGIKAGTVHFVAHSLGGLVVRWLLHDFPDQRPGRIVTLGTPHSGSRAAAAVARVPLLRRALGASVEWGLLGDLPSWDGAHELGVIAGTREFGIGRFFTRLAPPHDGTVEVDETCLDGMTDFVTVHATHLGMLYSAAAARQVCAFLAGGRFLPGKDDRSA
ncbi:MAG: alpha/beta hydrolase [Gammaproteobacteria bacterium]|nr:alpha/beta hydrolase [Gammaproteobacteria bacterium]